MRTTLSKHIRGVIKTQRGEFQRVLENHKNIFYMNFLEEDTNFKVQMYDRKRSLVNDGIAAVNELKRVLEVQEYSWISDKLKKDLVD